MKRITLAVVAVLVATSAVFLPQPAIAAVADGPDKLSCSIPANIVIVGGKRLTTKRPVVCLLGAKKITPKYYWKVIGSGIDGSVCRSSPVSLSQSSSYFFPISPVDGKTVLVPATFTATLTVVAKDGLRITKVTKTWKSVVSNASSVVLCDNILPKLLATSGPGVPICTWGVLPTLDGTPLVLRAGKIVNCVGGDGNCKWLKLGDGNVSQPPFVTTSPYMIVCYMDGGKKENSIWLFSLIGYAPSIEGGFECRGFFYGLLSVPVDPTKKWGFGYIRVAFALDDPNADSYSEGAVWYGPWIRVNGNVNPCNNGSLSSIKN